MFFYLLHLYLLKLLYLLALAIWGANRGDYFGFSSVPALAVQHPAGRGAVPGGALVRRFQGAAGYRLVEVLLRRGASRSR